MARTRFVMSSSEIDRAEARYAAPTFADCQILDVTFRTDADIVAELLPPPLRPATEPTVRVSVTRADRPSCLAPFSFASVSVSCAWGGETAWFPLTMPSSTASSVTLGRELYGEPRKLATVLVDHRPVGSGVRAVGSCTRRGVTFVEAAGDFDEPPAPVTSEREEVDLVVKHFPAADGRGLDADPLLVRVVRRVAVRAAGEGLGSVTFRESAHDPVIDLPIGPIDRAGLTEADVAVSATVVATLPAAELRPWSLAKTDRLDLLSPDPLPV